MNLIVRCPIIGCRWEGLADQLTEHLSRVLRDALQLEPHEIMFKILHPERFKNES